MENLQFVILVHAKQVSHDDADTTDILIKSAFVISHVFFNRCFQSLESIAKITGKQVLVLKVLKSFYTMY